ncbi:hypothetical protein ABBQ32_005445 [Trebouxia sp. C0010 RCD-2024]
MRWQVPTGLCCLLPLVLAVLVACLIPRHINKALRGGVKDQIVWSANSPPDTYARYVRDDHPGDPVVQTDFYLLNITNLAGVKAGSKPVLQQLGPYLYKKHTVKRNIWFDNKGRVAFTRDEFYTELPSNSLFPSLDDVVTTVNVPLLGALAKAHSIFGRFVAIQLLLEVLASFHDPNVDGLFMKRTVRELLWGYDDPLLQKLKLLAPGLDTRFQLVPNTTASSLHPSRQDIVNTGVNNISAIWDTEVWSNHTTIKSWRPPHLEPVQGSDGTQFRPDLTTGNSIVVWAPDLFRSASMTANSTVSLEGVRLLRFGPDPSQGKPSPAYYQTFQGLMNVTSPIAAGPEGRAGAAGPPVFLSNAHFCDVDSAVADTVLGLNCSLSEHVTFLDVEPITGITMRAAKRLMMSTEYGPEWQAVEPRVKKTFLPIFWVEEKSQATAAQCNTFKKQVYSAQKASKLVLWVAVGVACFFGVLAVILLSAPLWDKRHSRDPETGVEDNGQQEPLLAPDTPSAAAADD